MLLFQFLGMRITNTFYRKINQLINSQRRCYCVGNEHISIFSGEDIAIKHHLKEIVTKDFTLVQNFINTNEESSLMQEIEKSFRRTKYQYDHWDGVSVKK